MSALRLTIAERPGNNRLDGGWWPHSRDLATEFPELVEGFPPELGKVVRAVYSPPDWDDSPRRVTIGSGHVKVGKFPRDDTHVIHVRTSRGTSYCLLVVPPAFDRSQGEEALLASSTRGNQHAAGELLDVVTNELAVDPAAVWSAEGGH